MACSLMAGSQRCFELARDVGPAPRLDAGRTRAERDRVSRVVVPLDDADTQGGCGERDVLSSVHVARTVDRKAEAGLRDEQAGQPSGIGGTTRNKLLYVGATTTSPPKPSGQASVGRWSTMTLNEPGTYSGVSLASTAMTASGPCMGQAHGAGAGVKTTASRSR